MLACYLLKLPLFGWSRMGYKSEQFTRTVDENLYCSICREVFEDPVSCKAGHTFCATCIREWLRNHNKCPLDNGVLSERDLVRNLAIKGIIDNLDVYCHRQDCDEATAAKKPRVENDQKCSWTGKLRELVLHCETCPFQEIPCSHEKCSALVQRNKLDQHKKICKFRMVVCGMCGLSFVHNWLKFHKDDYCPFAWILCPNKCVTSYGSVTKIQRQYMDGHLRDDCGMESVSCPFSEQGCSDQVLRKDLDNHLQDKISSHMLLLANQNTLISKENTLLLKQNSFISGRNTSLHEKIVSLERQNQEMKNELCELKTVQKMSTNSSYTWSIEDYPSKANANSAGSFISSPEFCLCGIKWQLRLYPKGTSATNFTALNLRGSNSANSNQHSNLRINRNTPIVCRISVLNMNAEENDFVMTFTTTLKSITVTMARFIQVDAAKSPKYCSGSSKTLNIQFTINICNH